MEFDLYTEFHERKRIAREITEPFREELAAFWDYIKNDEDRLKSQIEGKSNEELAEFWKEYQSPKDTYLSDLYEGMSDDELEGFKQALGFVARSLPKDEKAAFWRNFRKQVGRDFSSMPDRAITGTTRAVHEGGTWGWEDFFGSEKAIRERDEKAAKFERDFARRADFFDDVKKIAEQDHDPIHYLTEAGSWARVAESAAYAAPGAIGTTLMAGIPFIGQAAFYGLAREGSYQEFRAEFEAAGDSWDVAREKAMTLSTIAAPMELAMERMQLKFLKGKLPFFEKAMQSATKRINSLPARMATRIGAMTLAEGSIETGQEYINPVLQELANGLGMDVPDQEWLNGEDGIFDGFCKMHAEMLLVMLPIAVFGGAKGAIADGARVQAFREATDRQLLALGANQQDIDAFRQEAEAGRTGAAAAEMNRLIENLDPTSESAMDATQEEAEAIQRQVELAEDLRRLGMFPEFQTGKHIDGVNVIDPETGEQIGTAADGAEATAMAFQFLELKEESMQSAFDEVASLVEAARLNAEAATDKNAAFDVRPAERMTLERKRSELVRDSLSENEAVREAASRQLERIETQVKRLEALEKIEGGDGSVTREVFGEMETFTVGKERSLIRRLYANASVLTLAHEDAHANFKVLLEKGIVTLEETAAFFLGIDKALAGKKDRYGNELRFIPEGVTDPSFEHLDEAIAEFSEVMLLRSKGGKKTEMRSLLGKNLSAMVKNRVPGAAKFAAFIRGMREMFGRVLSRKVAIDKAIRDGVIDENQIEEFRAMLQGTSLQEEFDADVKSEFHELIDDYAVDPDNVPFSIGRTTALPSDELSVIEIDAASVPSRSGELRKFIVDTILRDLAGQTITVASTEDQIKLPESRTQAKQSAKSRNPNVGAVATQLKSVIEGAALTSIARPEGDSRSSKGKNRRFHDTLSVLTYAAPVRIGGRQYGAWFTALEKESGELMFDSLGIQEIKEPQGQRTNEGTSHPPQAATMKVAEFGYKVKEVSEGDGVLPH